MELTREEILLYITIAIFALRELINFVLWSIAKFKEARRPSSPGGESITLDEFCAWLRGLGDSMDEVLSHPYFQEMLTRRGLSTQDGLDLIEAFCRTNGIIAEEKATLLIK